MPDLLGKQVYSGKSAEGMQLRAFADSIGFTTYPPRIPLLLQPNHISVFRGAFLHLRIMLLSETLR